MGIGAIFNDKVYAYNIPSLTYEVAIVHLELLNVLVALRRWKHYISNSKVKIYCDNAAVVAALNNFKIKDRIFLLCVRNIWLELAVANIDLVVEHIPGVNNVYADILSKWEARDKFAYSDIEKLHKCDWYSIDDSYFYLNPYI